MIPDNKTKPWQDVETLRHLYHDKRMSMQEIADHFGDITSQGIKYWIDKHGIEKRNRAESAQLRWLKTLPTLHTHEAGYEFWYHQHNGTNRLILAHRLLAVHKFGFKAVKNMVVHHKNGVPWDNRPSNIELMTTAEHATHHHHSDD